MYLHFISVVFVGKKREKIRCIQVYFFSGVFSSLSACINMVGHTAFDSQVIQYERGFSPEIQPSLIFCLLALDSSNINLKI